MATILCFLFFLFSSAIACKQCVYQSKATSFSSSASLSSGACGYGSLAPGFNGGHLAAGVASLFRDGVGCGGCFQIRCKNQTLCSSGGTKVILTDLNKDNQTSFVLTGSAFAALAKGGLADDIVKLGIVDVEYKRIPCDYGNQNLSVRVEETSQKPQYLAIDLLFQGGQTDIFQVKVAQVGTSDWTPLSRNKGAVWDTSRVPAGALQFQFLLQEGFYGKWVLAPTVLPADWKAGVIYDAGVQITDVAEQNCSDCGDGEVWQ
ncbi:hypothetical protein NE237_017169 [Protea cynaroides]|uniref:Expansin-like A2 n=1 Tax=Protea cynaroides TaxID=273540 RepID=A0A9Q0QMJ3_9MAGN|nr:hypothetical protein NE237_017169 [Protea cynaroides]